MPLNIIIVGGGIGGLAAAVALRQAGHHVKVFERSGMNKEIGAAVTVPPNSSRILLSWGLDFIEAQMTPYKATEVVQADVTPMRLLEETYLMSITERYGAPYVTCHRVDLHNALRDLAAGSKGPGQPVDIVTNTEVVSYDPMDGSISLRDSSTRTADLIVAADGLHSNAPTFVLREERPAISTDTTVLRFMIPSEQILANPLTAPLLAKGDGQFTMYCSADRQTWLLRYPCRNNSLQNFVAYTNWNNADQATEKSDTQRNRASLLERLKTFDPAILELCKMTEAVLPLWRCKDREPLPKFYLGRVVLVGDANHPMMPHFGQGSAQAVEDAAVLALFFPTESSAGDVPHRLELFQKISQDRVSGIQMLSRTPVFSFETTPESLEKARPFIPHGEVPMNTQETMAFCYKDALADARSIIEEHLAK